MTVTSIILELIFLIVLNLRHFSDLRELLDAKKKNPEQVSNKAEIKFTWFLIMHPLNGPPGQ